MKEKAKIAVLVSGGGTNLQALIDAGQSGILHSGEIVLVVSNKEDAFALTRAKKAGISTAVLPKSEYPSGEAFEAKLTELLEENGIDLIILAGFMRILSARFTAHFARRIINIHPSLIPAFCGEGFYGLRVHRAALECGVKVTGATVHFVNEIPDGGEIILQKAVAVLDGDTPETLQKRVMEEAEWILLPQAAEKVCKDMLAKKGEQNMNVYAISDIAELIRDNPYVGRGIVIGKTPNGKKAVAAYFIMGRSENSRNRVFAEKDGALFTEPFDASKVKDPSLIIYAAVRAYQKHLIVTNGDQTDTVYEGLQSGLSFADALAKRAFEPDAPNFTPRISGLLTFENRDFSYQMSILKSIDEAGSDCARYTFAYPSTPGLGHFIHTYIGDGNPLPTFCGEPERVATEDGIDAFTDKLWNALNAENKISLYVRYTDLETGIAETRIVNKNR